MDTFGALPNDEVRQRLAGIGDAVRRTLGGDDRIRLLRAPRPQGYGWSGRRSVFTFAIRSAEGWMSPRQMRITYEALHADMSGSRRMGEDAVAALRCQLGQPVEPGGAGLGALRIAISAAQLEEGTNQQAELSIVMEKLVKLLDGDAAGSRAPVRQMSPGTSRQALLTA
jgi:hypothetical protein